MHTFNPIKTTLSNRHKYYFPQVTTYTQLLMSHGRRMAAYLNQSQHRAYFNVIGSRHRSLSYYNPSWGHCQELSR